MVLMSEYLMAVAALRGAGGSRLGTRRSGGHRTVKMPALVAVPALVVTVMCPVVVPAATVAVILTAELTT